MKLTLGAIIFLTSLFASAECLSLNSIRSTKVRRSDQLEVSTSRGKYIFDLRKSCWGLDRPWTTVGFETSGSFICTGDLVLSIDRTTHQIQDRCVIWDIRQ